MGWHSQGHVGLEPVLDGFEQQPYLPPDLKYYGQSL